MSKKLYVSLLLFLSSFLLSLKPTLKTEIPISDIILQKLTWQDRERTYWLHLPPASTLNKPLPVLFHLHGGGGTGKQTPKLTFNRFNELADIHGFIVVYPDAIDRSWNDGRTENLKPQNRDVDDVGFIVEIINKLSKSYSIDSSKIFTAGMSNGGFMSSRLLCDRADLFRGGAILTASISEEYLPKCNPEKPVAVLVMNGTEDPLVPYDGGEIKIRGWKSRGSIISNDDFVSYWKNINGCNTQVPVINLPDQKRWDGTKVSVTTYSDCDERGALKFYKIEGGGHTWPGGKQYLGRKWIGRTSKEINACDEIWDFFSSLP